MEEQTEVRDWGEEGDSCDLSLGGHGGRGWGGNESPEPEGPEAPRGDQRGPAGHRGLSEEAAQSLFEDEPNTLKIIGKYKESSGGELASEVRVVNTGSIWPKLLT